MPVAQFGGNPDSHIVSVSGPALWAMKGTVGFC
jgi:hypothetical protein